MRIFGKRVSNVALVAALALCAAGAARVSAQTAEPRAQQQESESGVHSLRQAAQLLQQRRPQEAIRLLDEVIEIYEAKYRNPERKVYGARSQAEALVYLLEARKHQRDAVVIDNLWGDAIYGKAFALIQLRQPDAAKAQLERAIALSPRNAQYLGELGFVHHTRREWAEALSVFTVAETAARELSPPNMRLRELGRSLRGQGFSLIELGRLEEAEEKYRECLRLDADDRAARNQLGYIEKLRARNSQNRPTP